MTDRQSSILQTRTRALAQPLPAPDLDVIELVEFSVGDGVYCLESSSLTGVQSLSNLTPLPGTPDFVAGLMAVRGRILSVLDLRRLLGVPGRAAGLKVLLVGNGSWELGLVVDAVAGTLRVSKKDIVVPPEAGSYGVGLVGTKTLLQAGRIMDDPRIVVYQGAPT